MATAFAEWLRSQMALRGWSQSGLAREICVTRSTLCNWLRGGGVSYSACEALARVFGFPLAELLEIAGLAVGSGYVLSDISEIGALRLAAHICIAAREDAEGGDTQAFEFLRSEFVLLVIEVLEDSSPKRSRLRSRKEFDNAYI